MQIVTEPHSSSAETSLPLLARLWRCASVGSGLRGQSVYRCVVVLRKKVFGDFDGNVD